MPRKRKIVETRIRLYPGQDDDDKLISWLEQFEDTPYGTKQQAVKAALLRGIEGEPAPPESIIAPAAIDWTMLRQVVSSAMQTELAQIQVITSPAQTQSDQAESAIVAGGIDDILGGWNDEDEED
jgi:hypothetical protein